MKTMSIIKLNEGLILVKTSRDYLILHDGFKIITQDVNFAMDYVNRYAM